jgi:hypothetical protein
LKIQVLVGTLKKGRDDFEDVVSNDLVAACIGVNAIRQV